MSRPVPPVILTPDAAIAQFKVQSQPVAPQLVPLAEARGRILAVDLPGPAAGLPARPLARRDGYGVMAADLTGASAFAPLWLSTPPGFVAAGAALPPGCDAILPPDLLQQNGLVFEVAGEVSPGEGVLTAAHHLAPGARALVGGSRLDAAALLLAQLCGADALPCRLPRVALHGGTGPVAEFLRRFVQDQGADQGEWAGADLLILLGPAPRPEGARVICDRLALNDLQEIALGHSPAGPWIALPDRVEPVLLAALALIGPMLDHLSARQRPAPAIRPLARKISSAVGLADLVLLAEADGRWQPLPGPELSLGALTRASAFVCVPAEEEGLPAGDPLAAHFLEGRL